MNKTTAPVPTLAQINQSHDQDVIWSDFVLRDGTLRHRCIKAEGIGRCYLPALDYGTMCSVHFVNGR